MMKMIDYNKDTMTLHIRWNWRGKRHDKFLQCPFATWWQARKYFKRPKIWIYFGPMRKKDQWYEGGGRLNLKPQWLYRDYGLHYFVSTEYIKWRTPKWFPILMESHDISWKDKFETPRYERPGFFSIIFGRNPNTAWQFVILFKARKVSCVKPFTNELVETMDDDYWEDMIWYLHYYDQYNVTNRQSHNYCGGRDIREAVKKCPWGPANYMTSYDIRHARTKIIGNTIIDNNKYYIIDVDISEESDYTCWAPISSVRLLKNEVELLWSRWLTIVSTCDGEYIRVLVKDDENIDVENFDINTVRLFFDVYVERNFLPGYLTKKGIKEIYENNRIYNINK